MLTEALSPFEIEAMLLSLKVGIWSTLGALPVAIALAWLLARHDFYGKTLIDALLHLPLVLPPVSIGFILLILFGRNGWVGKPLADWFGLTVMFKWEGAAIASAVMALPLTVGYQYERSRKFGTAIHCIMARGSCRRRHSARSSSVCRSTPSCRPILRPCSMMRSARGWRARS